MKLTPKGPLTLEHLSYWEELAVLKRVEAKKREWRVPIGFVFTLDDAEKLFALARAALTAKEKEG
jgi:hypothetical protein